MMNYSALKKYYSKKYNISSCIGPTEYPKSWDELHTYVFDDWNTQIACVFAGNKPLAVTDYGQFDNPEDNEAYYLEGSPKDIQLREASKYYGIGNFQNKSGTEYWYKPGFEHYARILEEITYGKIHPPPSDIYDIVRSVLLGYTDISIIVYNLFQQTHNQLFLAGSNVNSKTKDELTQIYLTSLPNFIQYYVPLIEKAKVWIQNR